MSRSFAGIRLLTLCVWVLLAVDAALAFPSEIILLRHAEKPPQGPELSTRGWERARALPQLFLNRAEFRRFGEPAALYAMRQEKRDHSIRAEQTLKYVAESFRLPIQPPFTRYETEELVAAIRDARDLDGKQIVICWEHHQLEDIAKTLGIRPAPVYPSDRFDRAWIADFDGSGKVLSFRDLPQNLLEGDEPASPAASL